MRQDHLQTGLVVVEHDLRLVTSVADRFVAIEQGRIVDEETEPLAGAVPSGAAP